MSGDAVYYIEAGSYYVGHAEPLILRALLGTCVGVALYDSSTGIGGLIHIILPEPATEIGACNPAVYATTGMPLFVDAICSAGAVRERLAAYVAGGGLIGDIVTNDLAADIGGRTVDIVVDILKQNNITIAMSETGGIFKTSLSLDLGTGQCNISPIAEILTEPEGKIIKPSQADIVMAIGRIRPIPQVALKIIRMISDDNYNMLDVAEEVRHDQVIASRVLTLANSAMIGWPEHIDSIDEALMLLGEKKILTLVVSASVEQFFVNSERGYSQCKGTLYHHAINVAVVSERLALMTGRCDPAVAYTAGLLHDIGKVVLDRFVAKNMPFFYRKVSEYPVSIEDAETEILGIGHQDAGRMLAELWSLPENLTEAIKCHHNPDRALHDEDIVSIVSLSNALISRFLVSQSLEAGSNLSVSFELNRPGLDVNQLYELLDNVPWNILNSVRS